MPPSSPTQLIHLTVSPSLTFLHLPLNEDRLSTSGNDTGAAYWWHQKRTAARKRTGRNLQIDLSPWGGWRDANRMGCSRQHGQKDLLPSHLVTSKNIITGSHEADLFRDKMDVLVLRLSYNTTNTVDALIGS